MPTTSRSVSRETQRVPRGTSDEGPAVTSVDASGFDHRKPSNAAWASTRDGNPPTGHQSMLLGRPRRDHNTTMTGKPLGRWKNGGKAPGASHDDGIERSSERIRNVA